MKRREILRALLAAPLAAACGPPPPPASTAPPTPLAVRGGVPLPTAARLHVLCVAAHPDDAESGCGGTLARYVEAGHDVHVLYVTKGEVGLEGRSPDETGAIRMAEAEEACRILGATPHFFGHPAGALVFSASIATELGQFMDTIAADVVFAHWPIDTNYDHEVSGMLAINAWLARPHEHPLYFFEVESGTQTLGFTPSVYVEIGPVVKKKVEAIRAHKSQDAERRLYERHHEPMERFRAREIGGTAAEAFAILAPEAKMTALPGL